LIVENEITVVGEPVFTVEPETAHIDSPAGANIDAHLEVQ
jgi:hypothetical protein